MSAEHPTSLNQQTLATDFGERTEEYRHGLSVPSPSTTDQLTVARIRNKRRVNTFLEEYHSLQGVPGWKAVFGATYKGYIVGLCVLSRPSSRHEDDDDTIEISRFATRPDRPMNTGSWLIAKARRWAALEGFDEMLAYAGVAGNQGKVYAGSGFECVNADSPDTGGGGSWSNRTGRTEQEAFERRKWVYDLRTLR